ncbi:MAG: molybdopterin-dependent oxidoreductase [Akkermansiaceae bacterium]|nr:molybdopterin-dependent oxidoreductase [Armatimonadota bacterium]
MPSKRPLETAPVPRLTPREEWERKEAVPAIPASPEDDARIRRMSRRSLLWAGVTLAGTLGGLWAFNRNETTAGGETRGVYVPLVDGTKAPFRKALGFNEVVARNLFFSPTHMAQEFPLSAAITPRNNYHGDTPQIDTDFWSLTIEGEKNQTEPRAIALADIKTLPEVSQTTELKCIEGWSAITNWTGVRFYDFLRKFPPPEGTKYIGMFSEPEGQEDTWYYIGLDIESAMHPQALLAYAMNGETLDAEHGAPLRLIMPHKYGIKNIKLITRMTYTNERPADYWYDRGYDWYAGL